MSGSDNALSSPPSRFVPIFAAGFAGIQRMIVSEQNQAFKPKSIAPGQRFL
jgi:hypothetical protein